MREFKAQKKLIDIAFENAKLPKNHQGYKIYKALVFHRFFEVLSNAYPIFYEEVDKKRFEKIIYEFMRYGAKSEVMWKLPNEFRTFVKKHKKFQEIPYVNELLWFEWVEVALMMRNYKSQKEKKFSYSKNYKLNSSVLLKKLDYKVFEKESYDKKGEYYLLAYYDFNDLQVYYREISLPMYMFLKELNKNGLNQAINLIAKKSKQTKKEVKEFFKASLEELINLRILKRI
ncbi:putative DNA-binding domain-containing protein [Sulfurospirillum arcachonense]|uniref:HvfC/BufC family peptide modification chaperone n=1 Tax=Sulfurospirillum arcachonense TaxID=57666 RepID=UPI0004688CD0|nr:putative DNA-binding domain-containing protein [Sulfurospirillum arcachonense]